MLIAFRIVIVLLLLANCFGAYGLIFNRSELLANLPKVKETGANVLSTLPFINIIGLIGLLLWQSWAAYVVLICCVLVIIADIYFSINYHLFLAIPSTVLLAFFIYKFWTNFN